MDNDTQKNDPYLNDSELPSVEDLMRQQKENDERLLKSSIAREENNKKKSELKEVFNVTIAQSGEKFMANQNALEVLAKQHKRMEALALTAGMHLHNFCDRFESKWESDEQCESPEVAQEYIDAARFLEKNFSRTKNWIGSVTNWKNNYLPFGDKQIKTS